MVQARDGFVHVFLPPLEQLERSSSWSRCSIGPPRATGLPVVLEGYRPPPDPRVRVLLVTPDPGVIEVNVHPTASWRSWPSSPVRSTRWPASPGSARRPSRSTAGTAVPAAATTSPWAAPNRPVPAAAPAGPAGQPDHLLAAPPRPVVRVLRPVRRADQPGTAGGRGTAGDAVRAGDRLRRDRPAHRRTDSEHRPWAVDRALRHLLTDITGNTHRSEFCIDKLYSPDSLRGRLGLLELRGFEMPPHPDMALVQALLVRALVARFAEQPYSAPLVRWGTRCTSGSCCRTSPWPTSPRWSPICAPTDSTSTCPGSRRTGVPLPADRDDGRRRGRARTADRDRALARPGGGLTSGGHRTVRRLLDRAAAGQGDRLRPGRHLLTCNGAAVPLTPTGTPGEYVAGVRYKAWKPWSRCTRPWISTRRWPSTSSTGPAGVAGRCDLPRRPSGRPLLRPPAGQRAEAEARRAGGSRRWATRPG